MKKYVECLPECAGIDSTGRFINLFWPRNQAQSNQSSNLLKPFILVHI